MIGQKGEVGVVSAGKLKSLLIDWFRGAEEVTNGLHASVRAANEGLSVLLVISHNVGHQLVVGLVWLFHHLGPTFFSSAVDVGTTLS